MNTTDGVRITIANQPNLKTEQSLFIAAARKKLKFCLP